MYFTMQADSGNVAAGYTYVSPDDVFVSINMRVL
jgi:hypothetical protein